jgi:hypothetical protein
VGSVLLPGRTPLPGRRQQGVARTVTDVSRPPSVDPLAPLVALPGVQDAILATRLAVDRLAAHRVLRRRGDEVRTESVLRGAALAASTELGRPVAPAELRASADDGVHADPMVRGSLRAYAEVGSLVPVWRQAPRQALARLHTLAARDVVSADALGRPQGAGSTARLDQLAEVLAATHVPALVVAAVVHGELATLRPFGSADRVVAMAASRLVLIDRGLDPGGYAVVEIGHQDRAEDDVALRAFASGTVEGVAAWVLHCAAAVRAGAREALAIAESILRG